MTKSHEDILHDVLEAQGATEKPTPEALIIIGNTLANTCEGDRCYPDANATSDA